VSDRPKSWVKQHIDRCVECYGNPLDEEYGDPSIARSSYEQMRADLMLAVGMLAALDTIALDAEATDAR